MQSKTVCYAFFGVLLLVHLSVASCAPIPQNQQIGVIRAVGPAAFFNGRAARDGEALYNGTRLATGSNSSIKATFDRGGFVQLNENTDPTFQQFIDAAKCIIRVALKVGEIFAESSESCSIETQTPNASVTQHSGVNIRVLSGRTEITVLRGSATLAAFPNLRLARGEQITIEDRRIISRRKLNRRQLRTVARWRTRYPFPELIRMPDLRRLHLREGGGALASCEPQSWQNPKKARSPIPPRHRLSPNAESRIPRPAWSGCQSGRRGRISRRTAHYGLAAQRRETTARGDRFSDWPNRAACNGWGAGGHGPRAASRPRCACLAWNRGNAGGRGQVSPSATHYGLAAQRRETTTRGDRFSDWPNRAACNGWGAGGHGPRAASRPRCACPAWNKGNAGGRGQVSPSATHYGLAAQRRETTARGDWFSDWPNRAACNG